MGEHAWWVLPILLAIMWMIIGATSGKKEDSEDSTEENVSENDNKE